MSFNIIRQKLFIRKPLKLFALITFRVRICFYRLCNINKIKEIEDGPKKEALLLAVANQMKRDYLNWNRETVNDLLILDDLHKLSGEAFTMPAETKLTSTNEILGKPQPIQQQQQAKKKKAKKQQVKKMPNPNRPTKK